MTKLRIVLVGCGLVVLSGRPCAADVRELYRSPFGAIHSLAANPSDGSWWVGSSKSVLHLSAEGAILSQTDGFQPATALSVDPGDGSCWVADPNADRVVHLAVDGTVAWSGDFPYPTSVFVDASDGSCWVGFNNGVALLAKDGTELWRQTAWGPSGPLAADSERHTCWVVTSSGPGGLVLLSKTGQQLSAADAYGEDIALDPVDGSCWVSQAMGSRPLARYSVVGARLAEVTGITCPIAIAVNPIDESLWVLDRAMGSLVQLAADGAELQRFGGLHCPTFLALCPADGSLLAGDGSRLIHFSSSGEMLEVLGGDYYWAVSANPTDGSCWVAGIGEWDRRTETPFGGSVVKVSSDGLLLAECAQVSEPCSVAVNPTDGSCWVGDLFPGSVLHLSTSGAVLWRGDGFSSPWSLSVNPGDGSCWVGDMGEWDRAAQRYVGSAIVHIAADGTELWRNTDFCSVQAVAVDPTDSSCWVGDGSPSPEWPAPLIHFTASGWEMWRGTYLAWPGKIAVNSADSSVWAADSSSILHLASDGTVLFLSSETAPELPIYGIMSIAVSPADGSCWVVGESSGASPQSATDIVQLAPDGTLIWQGDLFCCPQDLSLNSADGTLWVVDGAVGQLVHLKPSRFHDVPFSHWAYDEIEACVVAGLVKGYPEGTYQPDTPVSRDQMAVYIARALAGGDTAVPTGPAEPTFHDVPTSHWAYRYIEYAHANNIVEGYPGGTYRPGIELDRAQMAVFIARSIVVPTGDEGLLSYTPPDTPTFPDVGSRYWAYKYIEYIAEDGIAITLGYPDGLYYPELICTRDQMAVYIARAFKLPV